MIAHRQNVQFSLCLALPPSCVLRPVCVSPREPSACNKDSFFYIKRTWQIKWFWFVFVIFLRASPNTGTRNDSPWQPSIAFLNRLVAQARICNFNGQEQKKSKGRDSHVVKADISLWQFSTFLLPALETVELIFWRDTMLFIWKEKHRFWLRASLLKYCDAGSLTTV